MAWREGGDYSASSVDLAKQPCVSTTVDIFILYRMSNCIVYKFCGRFTHGEIEVATIVKKEHHYFLF
jgi:hypothetical protein